MFKYLAENIAFLLIKNKILDIEDREIYVYGIETILLNAILLICMLLLSLPFGGFVHFLGFLIFFIPLRIFVGGYHAKNSETCFILSVGMYAATLLCISLQPCLYENNIAIISAAIALIILFIWAPLINPNHPLADYQIKRNKKILYGIIVFDFVLFLIFSSLHWEIASSEIIYILLVAIVFILGKIECIVVKN